MQNTCTDPEAVLQALSTLRLPIQSGEYDLHRLVMDCLEDARISFRHEVSVAPRCRIDLVCGSIGVEIKRGHAQRKRVLEQIRRYLSSEELTSLILVTEHTLNLPSTIAGKAVFEVCLARLWGIAL